MMTFMSISWLSPLFLGHAFQIGDGDAGDEHTDGLAAVHDRHGYLKGVTLERLVEPRPCHLPGLARAHRHGELLLTSMDVADRLLGERDLLALGAVEERLVEGAVAGVDLLLEELASGAAAQALHDRIAPADRPPLRVVHAGDRSFRILLFHRGDDDRIGGPGSEDLRLLLELGMHGRRHLEARGQRHDGQEGDDRQRDAPIDISESHGRSPFKVVISATSAAAHARMSLNVARPGRAMSIVAKGSIRPLPSPARVAACRIVLSFPGRTTSL